MKMNFKIGSIIDVDVEVSDGFVSDESLFAGCIIAGLEHYFGDQFDDFKVDVTKIAQLRQTEFGKRWEGAGQHS